MERLRGALGELGTVEGSDRTEGGVKNKFGEDLSIVGVTCAESVLGVLINED